MSVLGIFIKQPVEVEVYGVQFAKDMADTDQINEAWQLIARDTTEPWDQDVKVAPYTATLLDNNRILVTTASIILPSDAPEGYRLNVANKSQSESITVGSISVPARGATVVVRSGVNWLEEAKSTSVLVDALNDQRVRTTVYGGTAFQAYKIEVTVNTVEGRVMQNEFIVEIEEE